MNTNSINPLTRLAFSIYENRGVYALLLGSGISRAAEIPTGWEITLDLVRKIANSEGVKNEQDWEQWYRDNKGGDPEYSTLVEQLGITPSERRSILHNYIEPVAQEFAESKKVPTAAHHAIADMVRDGFIKVIVTTNFDRLLESALREKGVESTVVSSVDALKGAEPLAHTQCYIFKIHGDYKDSRILNTDAELASYPAPYNSLLDRIFDDYGLITCGWSGEWDDALRDAILRAPSRRYSMFWASKGAPSDRANELITSRKGQEITIDSADTFFVSLRDKLQTLLQAEQPNPLDVDLLIAETKRYLSSPEYRIQLDDLFSVEVGKFCKHISQFDASVDDSGSSAIFQKSTLFLENSVAPIARMALLLGRWGEYEHADTLITAIRNISSSDWSKEKFGDHLKYYSLSIILTSYCTGSLINDNLPVIHKLLTTKLYTMKNNDSGPLINILFDNAWDNNKQNIWKQLPGYENTEIPFSKNLLSITMKWSKLTLNTTEEYSELFDTFELLSHLAYLEKLSPEHLNDVLNEVDHLELGYEWTPTGGSFGKHSSFLKIFQFFSSDLGYQKLLKAGFGKQNSNFLSNSLASMRKFNIHLSNRPRR